jgi:hypothetical protein
MAQPVILHGWPVGSGEIAGTIVSRRVILGSILIFLTAGGSLAQTANLDPTITDLQRQIQEMRSQMAKMQNRIAELETARGIAATISGPDPALLQSQNPPTQALQSQPGDTKSSEEPTSFHYKGLTLTPGGFLEGTMLLRTRNENADIANNYSAIPLNGSSNAKLSEFRGSARNSELSLLVQGTAGSTKLKGYVEADFLGAAPTANYVESNSWTPRLRQLWVQLDRPSGWTITAGQTWSLLKSVRCGSERLRLCGGREFTGIESKSWSVSTKANSTIPRPMLDAGAFRLIRMESCGEFWMRHGSGQNIATPVISFSPTLKEAR